MSINGGHQVPKRIGANSDISHPIPLGETVTVPGPPQTAHSHAEGRAVVVGAARGPHRYVVQFIGDPLVRERAIYRGLSRNVSRLCDIGPSFDDFF